MRARQLAGLGLVVMLLLSSACGFRLRGFIELPANFQPVYISGETGAANLAKTLAWQLQQSGVLLSPTIGASNLQLVLSDLSSSQRQLVFGTVEEYELQLQVSATALDAQGDAIFSDELFQSQRTYSYNRDVDSSLTRDSNRVELLRSMEDDLIRQLSLRIQALGN